MNFENRVNHIVPAADIESVARAFFSGNFQRNGYQVGNIIFVDDSSPSGTGVLEVAVVDQTRGKIESITVGWIKSEGEVLRYFKECMKPDAEVVNKNVRVPVRSTDLTVVSLECGCCGEFFKDQFVNQVRFDQDTGDGICDSCKQYYS